jgi:hypothetical protein
MHTEFWWGNFSKAVNQKFEKERFYDDRRWIKLAQDHVQWRALVNSLISFVTSRNSKIKV